MTPEKLDELERLLSEGTKPPLEVKVNRAGNPTIGPVGSEGMIAPWIVSDEDAALIVAAINALPELVAMGKEAAFLLERLADFDRSGDTMTEDGQRDWYGHVLPSLSRLHAALQTKETPT